ncbi:MAG: fused MFS/spermidine synthase [Nitrososphaerales archaeon]
MSGLEWKLKEQLIWLRIGVFVSGTVVMALEILGSRILAPSYGNSIFVWGSLIGVVLTGLSSGYYLGGRLADKNPSFKIFSSIIFSAGIYVILIPFLSPYTLETSLALDFDDRYGPLFTTTILLAPPSIILGMVSPLCC